MQRKTEKASMPTKSCIDCREKNLEIRDKDSEIRELKENVMKLEMEKVEVIHLLVSARLNVQNIVNIKNKKEELQERMI